MLEYTIIDKMLDVLDLKEDAILIPIHMEGFYNNVYAKQVKSVCPLAEKKYRFDCRMGEFKSGSVQVVKCNKKYYINFCNKVNANNKADFRIINKTLDTLKIKLKKYEDKIDKLAIPLPQLADGLSYDTVRDVVIEELKDLNIKIVFYI